MGLEGSQINKIYAESSETIPVSVSSEGGL